MVGHTLNLLIDNLLAWGEDRVKVMWADTHAQCHYSVTSK